MLFELNCTHCRRQSSTNQLEAQKKKRTGGFTPLYSDTNYFPHIVFNNSVRPNAQALLSFFKKALDLLGDTKRAHFRAF